MLQLSRIIFFQLQGAEVYVACFGEDKSDACSSGALHCSAERGVTEIGMHKENQRGVEKLALGQKCKIEGVDQRKIIKSVIQ